MSDFDTLYDEYLTTELSDETFIYKNPVTGEVSEGIGQPPLQWGEYPQGISENTDEAYNYDIFRSNYLPLPHEVYSKENLDEIKATEEGSQLTDPNWMVASKIVHSYLNRPRTVNVRGNVRTVQSEDNNLKSGTDYAKWGVNFMSAFDYNLSALAIDASRLSNAPDNVLKSMYYLMETADRDGMTLSNFGKGLYNVATDPFNLVGLGTLGIGVAGKYAGAKLTKMGLKELLKNAVLSKPTKVSAVVGAEGAMFSAADNLARQDIKVGAKEQEDINLGELGTAATAGAVIGERLGTAFPNVIEGVRRGIVEVGKKADNYIQNQDTGATLTTGVDPTVPIAKGLAKAGQALEKKQVIDIDEYGFYSKAFEETTKLKQNKGTSEQFKSMLLKAGVKEDEMKWTGLNDLFASNPKITKEEIIEHLKNNRIEVKEKILGIPKDTDEQETDLDFTEKETESYIVSEELNYHMERIHEDFEEMYKDDIIADIINSYNFPHIRSDGTLNATPDYTTLEETMNDYDPNQLTFDGVDPMEPISKQMLLKDLLAEKWEKDGDFGNMQEFLDNKSENPLAKKIKLKSEDVSPEGRDNVIQINYEIQVEGIAQNMYDMYPLETYVADTADGTEYRIFGNEDYGYSIEKDGVKLNNDAVYDLNEARIQALTDALDYGHVGYEPSFMGDELLEELPYRIDGPAQYTSADWQEPGGKNYREILFTNDNFKNLGGDDESVSTDHFSGYNNILAHVRVKDRLTPDGKNVLYIEEMQSDWAAHKRKHGTWGVRSKEEVEAIQKTTSNLSKILQDKIRDIHPKLKEAIVKTNSYTVSAIYKRAIERVDNLKTIRVAFEPNELQVRANPLDMVKPFDSEEVKAKKLDYGKLANMLVNVRGEFDKSQYPDIHKELDNIMKIYDTISKDTNLLSTQKAPEGPFVGDVNKWVSLVLKRLIRMAKDQGYDHVAWSPGEVQIPRYSLRRTFQEIEVTKNPINNEGFQTYSINAIAQNGYQYPYKFKEHKLSDAVGPTLSADIINNVKEGKMQSYKGDKLEVTNPGMVGFYNKALPSITSDVLKKFDKKSKVKPMDVSIGGAIEKRLGFDITDTMKEKADAGISLFAPTATVVGAGVTAKQMQDNEVQNGNT